MNAVRARLDANLVAESIPVKYVHPPPLNLDQTAFLEIRKRLVDGFAARPDRRGDVVLRERQPVQTFQLDQIPRQSSWRVEKDDSLEDSRELTDRSGEA